MTAAKPVLATRRPSVQSATLDDPTDTVPSWPYRYGPALVLVPLTGRFPRPVHVNWVLERHALEGTLGTVLPWRPTRARVPRPCRTCGGARGVLDLWRVWCRCPGCGHAVPEHLQCDLQRWSFRDRAYQDVPVAWFHAREAARVLATWRARNPQAYYRVRPWGWT